MSRTLLLMRAAAMRLREVAIVAERLVSLWEASLPEPGMEFVSDPTTVDLLRFFRMDVIEYQKDLRRKVAAAA